MESELVTNFMQENPGTGGLKERRKKRLKSRAQSKNVEAEARVLAKWRTKFLLMVARGAPAPAPGGASAASPPLEPALSPTSLH